MAKTPYAVRLAPRLYRQLRELPSSQRRMALRLAEALAINPRPPGALRIEGMTGLYSEAFEALRLVYKIEDQDVVLLFIRQE